MINFKKYGKRCLSLFLAASMILMPAVQTFAEEETAAATTDSTQTAGEDRETQRQNCYAIAPDSNSVENWPQAGNLCGFCNRYGYEQWGGFI